MALFAKKPKNPAAPIRAMIGERVSRHLSADATVRKAAIEAADIFYRPDFLTVEQCAALIAMIDQQSRPSTVLSSGGDYDSTYRNSHSCDMDRWDPQVRPIDESIAHLLGIDPVFGETIQGQRYQPDQFFRAHHDYFHEGEKYWETVKLQGGQRTWTAMIFLNDVPEGGATWFPEAGLKVAPRRGLLLAWNNMGADGLPNPKTLHEGMPVLEGTKYIVTKWFREDSWLK